MSHAPVSVLLLHRGGSELLRRSLASIKGQTVSVEQTVAVGIADDALQEAARIEPRLEVDFLDSYSPAVAFNRARPRVKGEFLAALESGDEWQPHFLERSLDGLKALDVEMVFSNWLTRDPAGNEHHSPNGRYYDWWDFPASDCPGWRLLQPLQSRAVYLTTCLSPLSSVVVRAEAFPLQWPEALQGGSCWGLLLERILRRPTRVGFTMEYLWTQALPSRPCEEGESLLRVRDLAWIRNRLRPFLSSQEYARLSADLAHCQALVAYDGLRRGDFALVGVSALGCARRTLQGLVHSPSHFSQRFLRVTPSLMRLVNRVSGQPRGPGVAE